MPCIIRYEYDISRQYGASLAHHNYWHLNDPHQSDAMQELDRFIVVA